MLVTEDGGVMPFGTPGGDVQIQAMLQVLLNVMHFGMDLQDAIEAPRVAVLLLPVLVRAVRVFPRPAGGRGPDRPGRPRRSWRRRGHEIKDWPDWTWLAGSVEAIRDRPGDRADRRPAPTRAARPTRSAI